MCCVVVCYLNLPFHFVRTKYYNERSSESLSRAYKLVLLNSINELPNLTKFRTKLSTSLQLFRISFENRRQHS
jgi:hypothetical protein